MGPPAVPRIEPLGEQHDRASFGCGEPALDRYVRQQASQDVRRRIARVFVATLDDPTAIVGFYTLGATAVEAQSLPADLARGLPKYPIPAALIGRLAVDGRYQGRSLGKYMLMDALDRTLSASAAVAIYAVVVDAKDDRARAFHERYGFRTFPDRPSRLFVPLGTVPSRHDTSFSGPS